MSVIDVDKFDDNLGLEMVPDLLEIFEKESKEILDKLKESLNNNNSNDSYRYIHSLKGSCSNMMIYDKYVDRFKKWQIYSQENKLDKIKYDDIENLVNRIIKSMKSLIYIVK
jgi:hypothetical protein